MIERLPLADGIAVVEDQNVLEFLCQGQPSPEESAAYQRAAALLSEGAPPVLVEIEDDDRWLVVLLALTNRAAGMQAGLLNLYFKS